MEYDTLSKEDLQKITKENYVFKCRDGNIVFGKSDFLKLKSLDWLIGNMINDLECGDCEEIIEISEPKNVFMSVVDTLRYNTIIIHDNVSYSYFLALCDKWCVPDWVFADTKESIHTKSLIKGKIRNLMLKKCINCHALFDLNENSKDSCKRHTGSLVKKESGFFIYSCCGEPHSRPCCTGYHQCPDFDVREDVRKIQELEHLCIEIVAKSNKRITNL